MVGVQPNDPYAAYQAQHPQPVPPGWAPVSGLEMPPEPLMPPAPSSGTAISCIVLAYLGAGAATLMMFISFSSIDHGLSLLALVMIATEALVFVGLAGGASAMLIGHPIGRWAVVAGCTVAVVVVAIVSTIMALYAASEVREAAGKPTPIGGDWSGVLAFGVGIVIAVLIVGVVMPAMLTGGMALAPSTKRWVERPRIR